MAKSDFDEVINNQGDVVKWKMTRTTDDNVDDNDKQIHSGHFMVSSLVDNDGDDEETTDDNSRDEPQGYDFSAAVTNTNKSYNFANKSSIQQLAIDASLTKLFECMTLAYSGKLTSPKWKNFKGIKVPLKDKIRLNNIIWREWHMQYIQGKLPFICQFEPPISEKMHAKAEAVVLEGKYWKRRLESVTAEYKKWRLYWRDRSKKESRDDSFMEMALHMDRIESRRLSVPSRVVTPQLTPPLDQHYMTDEDFYMDFTDTLFSSLSQPFVFPNTREMSQLGNADIIQPCLVQLQPSLDDFMDTLEPLPPLNEMMNNANRSTFNPLLSVPCVMPRQVSLPMDTNYNLNEMTGTPETRSTAPRQEPQQVTLDDLQNQNNQMEFKLPSNITDDCQNEMDAAASQINALLGSAGMGNTTLDSTTLVPEPNQKKQFDNLSPQIINVVLNPSLTDNMTGQATSVIQQQNTPQNNFPSSSRLTVQQLLNQQHQQQNLATNTTKTVTIIQNTPLQALLQGLTQTQVSVQHQTPLSTVMESNIQSNIQTVSLKNENNVHFDLGGSSSVDVPSSNNLYSAKVSSPQTSISKSSKSRSEGTIQNILKAAGKPLSADNRRKSSGSVKKDGDFLVPSTTYLSRHRNLAPAPSIVSQPVTTMSTPTVLGHLLTQGNTMSIKQEASDGLGNMSAFTPIQPAPVSLASSNTFTKPIISSAGDFTVTAANVSDFQKTLILAAVNQAMGSGSIQLPEKAMTTDLSNPSSPTYISNGGQFLIPTCSSPSSDFGSRSRHASNDSTGSTSTFKDDFDFQQPMKPFRPKNESERLQYKQMRRESHINAEQKRRGNIKVGFEMLHQLVPSLKMTSSSKSSIANTLGKAADYCRKLKQERSQMQDEAEILKQEIDALNNSISICQSQLPATGVPVTRQRADQMREKFDNYVRVRTHQNWKFWIFSIIIQNLLDSYNKSVSTTSMDELCRTVLSWLEQHCSLVALRPTVLNSLRQLCTTTSILSDPSKVPQQASQAVQNKSDLSMSMGAASSMKPS